MAASASDKLKKSYSFLSKTLSSSIGSSDTTLAFNNTTNVPTDTAVDFIIDRVDANGTATPTLREICTGVVSGSNLITVTRGQMGTTAQAHNSGAVVEFVNSAQTHNDLISGLLNEHTNPNGYHALTSNASITSSKVITGLNDTNGNKIVGVSPTGSAVNQVTVANAATGGSPIISATGTDSNIGLTLTPKGTGGIVHTLRSDGWVTGLPTPNTVTANGNRNYSLVFNTTDLTGYISNGMRLKATRTVTAPTQCTSLASASSQYYSKTSPSGMTFTNNFVVSGWVKLSSYVTGVVASRFNGTSGWILYITSTGQIQLSGYNAGSSNESKVVSYQSVPLNKWVHVAAQLDMATFTATTTTSYIMIDGVDAPASVARSGTNPTALVQAGNLEIGGDNGGLNPFNGKLAQVAIYNAKVTQATILASMHQTLSGSETSLISAYSFNNSINDLNANANNLTANASAVATNVDSPFAGGANASTAYTAGTTEFGIVQTITFSTNTTVVVQAPFGWSIPTSGGVSALAYSTHRAPLGFPATKDYWQISTLLRITNTQASASASTWYNPALLNLNVPIGSWDLGYQATVKNASASSVAECFTTLSTGSNTESDIEFTTYSVSVIPSGANTLEAAVSRNKQVTVAAATPYYLNHKSNNGGTVGLASDAGGYIIAYNGYL